MLSVATMGERTHWGTDVGGYDEQCSSLIGAIRVSVCKRPQIECSLNSTDELQLVQLTSVIEAVPSTKLEYVWYPLHPRAPAMACGDKIVARICGA